MDNVLYNIGLSFDSKKSEPKRRRFINNPIIIFLVMIWFVITGAICLTTDDPKTLYMFGDVGRQYNVKFHNNVMKILFGLICLSFQCIYYWNHKREIKPTYIVVLEAIEGSISANSIGVYNEIEFEKLRTLSSRLSRMIAFQFDSANIPVATSYVLVTYSLGADLKTIICYGLPYSVYYTIFATMFFKILGYQILYFYILCKYFKLKLIYWNEILLLRKLSHRKIQNILQTFCSIYREINEYDTTYWCKFLGVFWVGFGVLNVFWINCMISPNLHILMTIICVYMVVISSSVFFLVIFMAASVNKTVNKSYKLLNTLLIKFNQADGTQTTKIRNKMKVCQFFK